MSVLLVVVPFPVRLDPVTTQRATGLAVPPWIDAANRRVDQLDWVEDRPVVPEVARRPRRSAACTRDWRSRSDPGTARRCGAPCARRAARRARAAPGCRCRRCRSRSPFGRRQQLDAGNRLQQRRAAAGGRPAVREVAGVVIGDPRTGSDAGAPAARRAPPALRDVAHLGAERRARAPPTAGSSANSSPYSFIADPQPAALTTMRSTPAARRPRCCAARVSRACSMSRRAAPARRSSPARPAPRRCSLRPPARAPSPR